MSDILIAEISGKRPGDVKKRPTEKFITCHDKVIISNNSEGYITDWPIINVSDDYRDWYCNNIKNSERAWYAPMNRSYAIKYAREHGYKYLVQLDDNICFLEISYYEKTNGVRRRYREQSRTEMLDDYINVFKTILENTNAVMVGGQLAGTAQPDMRCMVEGYVYSIFMLKLENCPDVFQGDFEDDVEYRLKCAQMGLPVVQVNCFRYSKVGQAKLKDLTGCRAEYAKAGLKRGEHMTKLYSGEYSCSMTHYGHHTRAEYEEEAVNFKHKLKRFKVGVIVKDKETILKSISDVFAKYGQKKKDFSVIREKRRRG